MGSGVIKFFDILYPRLPVTVLTVYLAVLAVTVIGAGAAVPSWIGGASNALSLQWQGSWVATLVVGFFILPLAILLSLSFWGIGGYVFATLKGVCDGAILANLIYVIVPGIQNPFGGGITNLQWAQITGAALALVHGVIIMAFIAWPTGGVHVGTNLFYRMRGANKPEAMAPSVKLEQQMWYCAIAVLITTVMFVMSYRILVPGM